jgi:hypothetical protein
MLNTNHRQHLMSEGFNEAAIDRLISWGVRSILTPKAAHTLKISKTATGIWFPFAGEHGQLRVDRPKDAKYLNPWGVKPSLWVPPDHPTPSVITEGYKDAAAGTLIGGVSTGA